MFATIIENIISKYWNTLYDFMQLFQKETVSLRAMNEQFSKKVHRRRELIYYTV